MPENKRNFVERRALRFRVLYNKADEVWEEARGEVQDCCNSFREHYGGELEDKLENGHRIRLTRTFKLENSDPPEVVRRILLTFIKRGAPRIEITVDDLAPTVFQIDADERHAFISDSGREISVDEFAEKALTEHLFNEPEPYRPLRSI
jgi:hypothetical protein